MPKYLSEHDLTDAKTREEWLEIARAANNAVRESIYSVQWLNAWVCKDVLYCVNIADSEDEIYAFVEVYEMPPLRRVSEIKFTFDPGSIGESY